MTDITALNTFIKNSGMTITAIAEKAAIGRPTLYNKLDGKSEFTASEIVSLANVLHMTPEQRNAIFLSEKSN